MASASTSERAVDATGQGRAAESEQLLPEST
jgi:hypothetical protein